ncbi:MAG: DUF4038 domain-containing protein [Bacteroidaceae bacterium]|nr:DUF4038 domain-containing protein [Bacteroidaceae bacterium]
MNGFRIISALTYSVLFGLQSAYALRQAVLFSSQSHPYVRVSSITDDLTPIAGFTHGYRNPNVPSSVESWRVAEIIFHSSTDYDVHGADDIELDVRFVHPRSGAVLVRPAFWDGDSLFRVRFAPTMKGRWTWQTVCPCDASLNGIGGEFRCREYKGSLDIYRHGFVQAREGQKYLVYADGTPFFYLGDTHWGMYTEEYDEPGPHAGQTKAQSHFRYIVDRRVEQGFTVYQSEPIGSPFDLSDGRVDQSDIEGFRRADMYFQYIADRGLVHANAQFFFSSSMRPPLIHDQAALRRISRYWVARFGAYPVMWTLAQECDNDFYAERQQFPPYDWRDNPWVRVAEYIHVSDCYRHPLSAHQENAVHTSVTGKDVEFEQNQADGFGTSVFSSDVVAWRTGHSFWAAQWSPSLTRSPRPDMIWDYWTSRRPAVNYEGRYCGLWTQDFGARAQGWISFLSGFCGYGYGAIDIWLYRSTYDTQQPSHDGVDSISVSDKLQSWCQALEFESARQMIYLRRFLEGMDWWQLRPVLPRDSTFRPDSQACVLARTPDGTHVMYFYARSTNTGTMLGLRPGSEYKVSWFNPRSGEAMKPQTVSADNGGRLVLPQKPDEWDWTLTVKPQH